MIKPAPDFERNLGKAGLNKRELAEAAGVSIATVYGMLKPETQPARAGGVYSKTAWKLAKAIAAKTGEDEDTVYSRMFVEVEYVSAANRRITQSPA